MPWSSWYTCNYKVKENVAVQLPPQYERRTGRESQWGQNFHHTPCLFFSVGTANSAITRDVPPVGGTYRPEHQFINSLAEESSIHLVCMEEQEMMRER